MPSDGSANVNTIDSKRAQAIGWQIDAGLLFLRVAGAAMLFVVHGLPKALHYTQELGRIAVPQHRGAGILADSSESPRGSLD